MSYNAQSIHIRTTTTTTTTGGTMIHFNTSYLKTFPGILKVLQVVLGIICVGITGHDFTNYLWLHSMTGRIFFFLMVTTFMIGSCIQLASYVASSTISLTISKNVYEVTYNSVAFVLILAASITLIVQLHENQVYRWYNYEAMLAATIMGFINAALYCVSAFLAIRSYRGI